MGYGLRITLVESNVNVANNTSVVTVNVYASNTAGYTYWNANGATVGISCGGQQASFAIGSVNCGVGDTYLGSWSFTIAHNDSTGAASVGASAIFYTGVVGNLSASGSLTLTTIPRASAIDSMTCSTSYVDGLFTIKFTPKNNGFYYKLRLSIPGVISIVTNNLGSSGSTAQRTATHTFTSSQLATIMSKASTKSDAISIGAVIETYSNSSYSSKVGESAEKSLQLKIPASYVPSFTSVTATGVNLFGALYLTGRSSVKLTINGATGIAGSTIILYAIKGGNVSYGGTSNSVTSGVLTTPGAITFTATITDSRGRTASKTVSINVMEYSLPTLTMECFRCNASGVRDDVNGTYISVKPTFSYSTVTGNSIASKSLKIGTSVKSTSFASGTAIVYSGYSVGSAYLVYCSITDAVGNTTNVQQAISIASVPFNIKANKKGAAMGKYATVDGALDLAYQLLLDKALKINGVEQPVVTEIQSW